MFTNSNQPMKHKLLLFPGFLFVCIISFSSKAFARDILVGPIWNNGHATRVCPVACRSRDWKWTGQWRTIQVNRQSVCGCGEWRIIHRNNAYNNWQNLTDSERARYQTFRNAIATRGLDPADAAREIGGADYKNLQGNQFQIRLSRSNRVTFFVNRDNKLVTIIQIGGHT